MSIYNMIRKCAFPFSSETEDFLFSKFKASKLKEQMEVGQSPTLLAIYAANDV